jgi:outer membrane receptor protein involved in Fe transport
MPKCHAIFICAVVALAFPLARLSAQTAVVEGTVRDSAAAVVANASVTLQARSYNASSVTDSSGHFIFSSVPGQSGSIEVHSAGFAPAQRSWAITAMAHAVVDVLLEPASASEEVTVSATRTPVRLSETPGSTVLLSQEDVIANPALRVDDVLRQVPGFSLFRRSDSRTANASNQGVSLRGLGGTAASRALVLEDGFPLVDAFGGWVYWDRVPRESISNVEVFAEALPTSMAVTP